MQVRGPIVALVALVVLIAGTGTAEAASRHGLDMYTAKADAKALAAIRSGGYDVAESHLGGGDTVDLILTAREADRLRGQGVDLSLKRNGKGQTVRQQADAMAVGGFDVFRSYDEPGGIREELYALARRNPTIAKLVVIGKTIQGREIIALKITRDARRLADGARPASLYMGTVHAREWIATEMTRRLLHHFVDGYGEDAEITNLVNTRELWFMPVANPDGYQYTFTDERLWRKNLRNNDSDPAITNADGVDLNRNYDERWNYDNEGSSTEMSSLTYRGSAPASEPETKAHQALIDRMKFKFLLTYHSYGPLLLYPYGWQVQTPSFDDPLFVEYTGTDANPAVEGFDPGVGADLYTTNGTTDDYAYSKTGALSWTPELSEGCEGCGFVFPDDEALVQAEFEKNLPFALRLARSTPDPANPAGATMKPFYLETASLDPEKSGNPLGNFKFSVSYGDPQPVQVIAKRSLGAVSLKYSINGAEPETAPTSEASGGERYGEGGDVYYRLMRGVVTGTSPGDEVKVWFEDADNPAAASDAFTYTVRSDSGRRILVVAAEDYSGISPPYRRGPLYLSYYLDALAAKGYEADVYDVDANGRRAPSPLGVLGHYDAVIWYTGDDIITRDGGMVPGTASRLANDEMLAMRQYVEGGGRLLFTGKNAGLQYAQGYEFDLERGAPCDPNTAGDGCQDLSDDFLQYYLGAYLYNDDAGTKANGSLYDVVGVDSPFSGLSWSFGGNSANNQDHSASFIATSGILPKQQYPQFDSWASAKYSRPGGPFDPRTGSYYAYSGIADVSYKRLTRTIDLTGQTSGNLSFWMSRDTEPDWDYVFVEAHTVGQDDWTTLPDANGHTSQSTGPNDPDLSSCAANWHELHPWLARYQTFSAPGACTPTGTSGEWHAASGRSDGWEQWSVDLSRYAGKQVEVSISYASDWSIQGLGAFVDDTTVSTGETTSFEDGLGGWTVAGPPPGSAPNSNDWTRTTAGGFPEGAAVSTPWSIYLGFGVEGISTPAARSNVLGRAMEYLLR
ncbi:MAG TPA: M14 family zinc carboxypeptidase [Thermoleophilaceae bacterium]|nr:M14 family zinc carboxypeptidase [Thermoleophilaceae bacterium]